MIKDVAAHRRIRVDEERRALQAMDLDASIAVAEALLRSSIVLAAEPRATPRPLGLARALGISRARLGVRSSRRR